MEIHVWHCGTVALWHELHITEVSGEKNDFVAAVKLWDTPRIEEIFIDS